MYAVRRVVRTVRVILILGHSAKWRAFACAISFTRPAVIQETKQRVESLLIGMISFGNVALLSQMLGLRLLTGVQLVYSGSNISFGIDEYVFATLSLYVDIIGFSLPFMEQFGEKK